MARILDQSKADSVTYQVQESMNGYGVYAHDPGPVPYSYLVVLCKSHTNAILIMDILECDKNNQIYYRPEDDEDSILDTANGNILGYLDEKFHAHCISFNTDGGYELLDLILSGFGRITQLTDQETRAILDMMATKHVRITRKIFGIQLWSVELTRCT